LAALSWLVPAPPASADTLSVQVRQVALRKAPTFLSPVLETLPYGAQVEEREDKGQWVRVQGESGKTGWVHASAVTDKKVELQAGAADVSTAAAPKEVALAGKGFNREVESAYRAKHGKAAFAAVDAMEARKVAGSEVAQFLKEGDLSIPGDKR
jgi:uncharacterized protein YgiM (DUF1202 family)